MPKANLEVDAMASAGFVRSIELESDQRLPTLVEELERKEPGGEGVGGEGGADRELGGKLGKAVVSEGGEVSDRVFRGGNQWPETGVNCPHSKYRRQEVAEKQQYWIEDIHI